MRYTPTTSTTEFAENDDTCVMFLKRELRLPSPTVRRALRKAKIANNHSTALYSEDEVEAIICWNCVKLTYTVIVSR